MRIFALLTILALAAALPAVQAAGAQTLAAPGFHHLHLNSCDPEAAIAFYTKQFPSTAPTSWGGLSALQSPTNVLILFTKVATAPVTEPQTAIWHFGWHVPDTQARRAVYLSR